jgi:hypothetical protein
MGICGLGRRSSMCVSYRRRLGLLRGRGPSALYAYQHFVESLRGRNGVAPCLSWIFARSRRDLSPFWPACRPAPLAQAFDDLFRRTVKAAPTSARASASTSCCASGFSPTRGPRQFRRLGVNLFFRTAASRPAFRSWRDSVERCRLKTAAYPVGYRGALCNRVCGVCIFMWASSHLWIC